MYSEIYTLYILFVNKESFHNLIALSYIFYPVFVPEINCWNKLLIIYLKIWKILIESTYYSLKELESLDTIYLLVFKWAGECWHILFLWNGKRSSWNDRFYSTLSTILRLLWWLTFFHHWEYFYIVDPIVTWLKYTFQLYFQFSSSSCSLFIVLRKAGPTPTPSRFALITKWNDIDQNQSRICLVIQIRASMSNFMKNVLKTMWKKRVSLFGAGRSL